jgi:hypothetical protein
MKKNSMNVTSAFFFILPSKYILHGLTHKAGVFVRRVSVGQHLKHRGRRHYLKTKPNQTKNSICWLTFVSACASLNACVNGRIDRGVPSPKTHSKCLIINVFSAMTSEKHFEAAQCHIKLVESELYCSVSVTGKFKKWFSKFKFTFFYSTVLL